MVTPNNVWKPLPPSGNVDHDCPDQQAMARWAKERQDAKLPPVGGMLPEKAANGDGNLQAPKEADVHGNPKKK